MTSISAALNTTADTLSAISPHLDFRNSSLVAAVLPGLLNPLQRDGTLDIGLLNGKIFRDLRSAFGQNVNLFELGTSWEDRSIIEAPHTSIRMRSPTFELLTPMLFDITMNSTPLDGGSAHKPDARYTQASVSGLNLEIRVGTEEFHHHIGQYPDSGRFNISYSPWDTVINAAYSARTGRPLDDRYIASRTDILEQYSELLGDLVADYQTRAGGHVRPISRLFGAAAHNFDLRSVEPGSFSASITPTMDPVGAEEKGFFTLPKVFAALASSAEREGLNNAASYRELEQRFGELAYNLKHSFHTNHMDYVVGTKPGFAETAREAAECLAALLDGARALAAESKSLLTFEQANHAEFAVREIFKRG